MASDIKVLFVCLGNICRSPSAQAVFETQVTNAGLQNQIFVDSCGTAGYHMGEPPDSRSISAAENRGYKIEHLRGRKITLEDFEIFDYIVAMDKKNISIIRAMCPKNSRSNISLFLDFDAHTKLTEVPDPYYGGADGFENVLNLIESAGESFLDYLRKKHF
jgi:protein-tyrosine phosphatase